MLRGLARAHAVPLVQRRSSGTDPDRPDGEPQLLTGEVDVVLGVDPSTQRRDREVELGAGSTLLLYTDGLFERRRDPDDRAGGDLLDLVRGGAALPLPELCDHLVQGTAADSGDDIVVLALRLTG
jgi:serine phosphatase RsbU (regulator of sigma subunit)